MAAKLANALGSDLGQLELHAFPDGESYVRLGTDVSGRDVAIVCTLDRPNDKLLPLLFAAATARDLGAASVGLIAPYLAYMRQDRRFKPGEAVTSRQIANLLSRAFDWLVTIDPHLHRYASLAEIYEIPTRTLHAAPLVSRWIKTQFERPIVIGPDSESEQWVKAVAQDAGAPYAVLDKRRYGDRDVEISIPAGISLDQRTPVLVDDIISSGRTMIEAARLLTARAKTQPVCIAIHGIFADRSDELLAAMGARVVTCNTIPHASNAIDVIPLIADSLTGNGFAGRSKESRTR
jgi:ribose-phosphate pyrophosphokinase